MVCCQYDSMLSTLSFGFRLAHLRLTQYRPQRRWPNILSVHRTSKNRTEELHRRPTHRHLAILPKTRQVSRSSKACKRAARSSRLPPSCRSSFARRRRPAESQQSALRCVSTASRHLLARRKLRVDVSLVCSTGVRRTDRGGDRMFIGISRAARDQSLNHLQLAADVPSLLLKKVGAPRILSLFTMTTADIGDSPFDAAAAAADAAG